MKTRALKGSTTWRGPPSPAVASRTLHQGGGRGKLEVDQRIFTALKFYAPYSSQASEAENLSALSLCKGTGSSHSSGR